MTKKVEKRIGAPCHLTAVTHARVVSAISKVLTLNQAAALSKLPASTVKTWVGKGKQDHIDYIDSDYSRFSTDIRHAQALKVCTLIDTVSAGLPGWQASAWLLERCFREDFGADAGIIQELLASFKALQEKMNSK